MDRSIHIVLASSSTARRSILTRLGIAFEAVSPGIDEQARANESATMMVRRLAVEKAQAVADRFPNALIIGSDQAAEQSDGEIIGKPGNHAQAVTQLLAASGRRMMMYTGIALLNNSSGHIQSAVETFAVDYKELSVEQIERYLHADQPYQCCGSLKIESRGITLLKRLRGDDPNALVGLPVIRLLDMLTAEGVTLF